MFELSHLGLCSGSSYLLFVVEFETVPLLWGYLELVFLFLFCF